MPFKSKAQMKKMAMLMKQGKLSPQVFHEFAQHTNFKKLPLKVKSVASKKKTHKNK